MIANEASISETALTLSFPGDLNPKAKVSGARSARRPGQITGHPVSNRDPIVLVFGLYVHKSRFSHQAEQMPSNRRISVHPA